MAVMRVNSLQELKSKDEAYLTEKKETETKFKNEISSLNIQLESLRKQFLQSMIKTENLENQVRKLQEQVRNLGGIPVEYADINILGKEIN
jgi:archaellum component FlaC